MKLVPVFLSAALVLAGCASSPPQAAPSQAAVIPTPFAVADEAAWQSAIDADDVDAVLALIEADGAPTAIIDGRVALSAAAMAGSAEVMSALILAGSPVDIADDHQVTALHHAAAVNCAICIAVLIEAGADPLKRDRILPYRSPIHVAAAEGATDAVAALIDAGVPADTLDGANGHALLWAAYGGHTETALYLLEKGADPTLVDGSTNNASTRAAGQGHDELAALLADAITAWEASH
jgi:hypothetical protein